MEDKGIKYKELDPYENINFVERRALIKDKNGNIIFDEIVEFPDFYSDDSVNIVSSKYLCNEAKHKETSLRQMIDRVSETIANWGLKDGYFGSEEKENNEQYWEFLYKLKYYQINQYCAFNSPVYFNVGLVEKPQSSACQPGWALVNTEFGHIPIEKIVNDNMIGINVFDENGKTKVLAVKSNGDKEVIRIETNEGPFIEVTKDHIVFIKDCNKIRQIMARDLMKGMRLITENHVRNPEIINIKTLGVFPVYDIQTSSGKYLTNNILVHNCFILDVEDDMESIYDSIKLESLIFKHGSGSGINMSKLRGCKEKVHGGGMASGVCSFLKAADISAGVVRSGGTLRRSAKLVCLNDDHPDIQKFIHCKELEEKKLKILKEADIEPEKGQELSDHVFYQNTNISVRLSDKFMKAVEENREWETKYILTGETCDKFKAKDLLKEISELAWRTGDPGVQFSDNINKWNTCSNSGEIESSNPCSEFLSVPNTSCQLISINLFKLFYIENEKFYFDVDKFKDIINIVITAQDISISRSSYPSRKITSNSNNLRPIGLGYSNLGGSLMWMGIPYDSEDGRNISALLTSIMTGVAFDVSNKLSKILGPFSKFDENKDSLYKVLNLHIEKKNKLEQTITGFSKYSGLINKLTEESRIIWEKINEFIENKEGFRNSQVSLLAPTGTISFLMDCATKGIEPEYSLISYKTLSGSGGATIKMINPIVKESLKNLGYLDHEIELLYDELHSLGHFENSEILKKEHLSIFDTAGVPQGGKRSIDYMGHVKMVASVQPFLSGGISKTINLPNYATVEDIYNLYLESWKMGIKGITIYRDGSKTYQPLNTHKKEEPVKNQSRKVGMSPTRPGEIHKFSIGSTEGYLMTGMYDNGDLGETFLTVSKQGSTLSGLLDMLAIMISISLQHGVPLKTIVSKLMFARFDPSGITSNPEIRFATSICDYLGRYLGNRYLSDGDKEDLGLKHDKKNEFDEIGEINIIDNVTDNDGAPVCDCCGGMMQRIGTCFNCNNCGANSGACG